MSVSATLFVRRHARPPPVIPEGVSIMKQHNDVVCPDGKHHCPNDNTCCKLTSGDWGCCPLPDVSSHIE